MAEEERRQINVLVVDDDRDIADILHDFISDQEKSVDVCYDGLAAIDNIQKTCYDLVLVDLMMPRVDGLEVLRYAKIAYPDVIVIILTGYASLETAITSLREGAYDYIRKPCKLDEINHVVENALEKIRLYRENKKLLKKLQDAYYQLMVLKQEKGQNSKVASMNFFSSNLPALHYVCNSNSPNVNYLEKLQALSSLKDNGMLTDSEFDSFKNHLLGMIDNK